MRSLHWKMQIKGVWGTPPTSILQRKTSRCIYVCTACRYNVIDETKIVSSKTVIWLCRFPKHSNILVIRGVSALDKELLGTLVAEAREALETLEKQLVQAQEEYEEATKTAKRSNYICNELFTWADVYDTANHDERRAILQQFIKEIRVRKDYEISITLNASFNQVEQLKAVSTYDGAEIFEGISEKGA